jgi:RNA polymerase subunit RPABC4/transcription elongation factor Spt4
MLQRNQQTDATITEKHSEGLTDAAIGELLGITKQRVNQRRKRLGLAKVPRAKVYACKHCGAIVAKGSEACRPCYHKNKPSRRGLGGLLGESDIVPIFQARLIGDSVKDIAKRYGVSEITIYSILERRNWGWVTIPETLLIQTRTAKA